MDFATLIGLLLGFGAIVGGAVLEGLHLNALFQPTAALIVLGGTFGAAFVSFPMATVLQAFKDLKLLFIGRKTQDVLIDEICAFAVKARKNGIMSLEQDAQNLGDRFLKKAISLC